MVRIFFLPYLGNRSKSDPCSYELLCLESHILSFPKVLQISPESTCIKIYFAVSSIVCRTISCLTHNGSILFVLVKLLSFLSIHGNHEGIIDEQNCEEIRI